MSLADDVRAGGLRPVARALSLIERGGVEAEDLLDRLRPFTGRARAVALTGSGGVGKSSLAEVLGGLLIERGARVAVVAVDPSSPFTGGALLGDRIRMTSLPSRGGFVRSMATRGAAGGVAAATADAIDVLDAAGYEWVVVETVGVGQDEVDVADVVETVVVVTCGGLGDDVQASKAGLMEVADVFVVNKADLPGADAEAAAISSMVAVTPPSEWTPPVLRVSSATGEGVGELLEALERHHEFLDRDGRRFAVRRRRAARRVERVLAELVWARLGECHEAQVTAVLAAVAERKLGPYEAARRLLAALAAGSAGSEA